jgi:hippurate hydrolase
VHEALKVCGVDEIHTGIENRNWFGGWSRGAVIQWKMMGLRADMDALSLAEHNDFIQTNWFDMAAV